MIAAFRDKQGTAASNAQGGTKKMTARWIAVMLTLALVGCLALAGSAGAKVVHVEEGSFTGADAPGGPLAKVWGMTVDNSGGASDGDIYVINDVGLGTPAKVTRFDEDGVYDGVEFNGSVTPAGFFSPFKTNPPPLTITPDALGVDGSAGANSGDVYVVDGVNKVIDRFSEAGAYECQITGNATPSASECAGPTGSETPTELVPIAVAVDPESGDVYVGSGSVIHKFDEGGEYIGTVTDAAITSPGGLEFDPAGNLYVDNTSSFSGGTSVVKFDSSDNLVGTLTATDSRRVAIDAANERLYVAKSGVIEEFDLEGAAVSTIATGYTALSLTTGGSEGKVYSSTYSLFGSQAPIDIWSGDIAIPDVATNPASSVEETTATLNGEVDLDEANGGTEVENCEFEYGTTTAYGDSVPCSPATPYASAQVVTGPVTGLQDSTTYHFRLKASNENGIESFGADQAFITKGPPTVDDQSVSGITRFTANLEADVNPHGYATDVTFEYVDEDQYAVDGFNSAQTTAPQNIGAAETAQSVEAEVTGLSVDTEYHFRAIAESSHGEDTGSDESFETVVIAEIEDVFVVPYLRKAKIEVDVNPLGLQTDCHLEYVSDAEFDESGYTSATTVPCDPEDLGEGTERSQSEATITGLGLSTVYHARFVVSNSSGTVTGADTEFSTFGFKSFDFEIIDDEENPYTQAGGHPWKLISDIEMVSETYREETNSVAGLLKDVLAELPPGLIGNPEAVPKCKLRVVEEGNCSPDSVVGELEVRWGRLAGNAAGNTAHLYNTIPPKGTAARFAGEVNGSIDGFVDGGVRVGDDYGVNAGGTQLTTAVSLRGIKVELWGVPADESHDDDRCGFVGGCASNAVPKALLRMPTHCDGEPLEVGAKANTYQDSGAYAFTSTEVDTVTGCNQLSFEPNIEARPTTDDADSPTGLHVSIENPQNEDPEQLDVADVRDVEVTLPEGLVVNPASANGLEGCSESEADLDSAKASKCPDGSRVGRATVNTPLLDHPLEGGVYVAEPFDNPFDSLIALYIALDDPQSGVIVKVAGEVEVDEDTGQLSASFEDNPQLPFDSFEVDFFGGALAPLKTPATCGTYTVDSKLTPWSAPDTGPAEEPSDSWKIDDGPGSLGCASSGRTQPNAPAFGAGTSAPIAAAYSPFVVNLARADGTQQFKNVTVTPPPGLLARLAGTPYCPEAAIAEAAGNSGNEEEDSPSCPALSAIGAVHVSAGAGPAPYHVQGTAYLAGPYKGAPLSLAIVTPATAGPFDLGTVVVRAALHVNRETTQIDAIADPIPEILEGIPLNVRSVSVRMNKPGFTKNPTSCDPSAVNGRLLSTEGSLASLISRFQVGDCTNLDFKPRLGLRLFGKTNRGAHPAFRAVLSMPEGANITRAAIRLPGSEILDQGHIRTICTRVQFAAGACPPGAVYGFAKAWSPLLDQPLQGPVYLRSSDNELPDLVADLRGQVNIAVVGRIDSVNGGIRTTFETVPDAPVSRFMLTMKGANKGLLQNSTDICRRANRARAAFDAHNGAVADLRPALRNKRCARQKRKAAAKRRAAKRKAKRRSLASLASASRVATP